MAERVSDAAPPARTLDGPRCRPTPRSRLRMTQGRWGPANRAKWPRILPAALGARGTPAEPAAEPALALGYAAGVELGAYCAQHGVGLERLGYDFEALTLEELPRQ